MRLILDTVSGAEGDFAGNPSGDGRKSRIVRAFQIVEISEADLQPHEALLAHFQSAGMPVDGEEHPAFPALKVKRILTRGVSDTKIDGRIIYEGPPAINFGGPVIEEQFAVRDSSSLTQGTTQLLPGANKQRLVVRWNDSNDSSNAIVKVATLSYPNPIRNLVMYGVFSDRPSITVQNMLRKVNHAEWQGLPRGFWLCTGVDVVWSDADERYRVTCIASTTDEEDWSSYEGLRGPDGEYLPVPQNVLDTLALQTYEFGVRHSDDAILKVGLFKTANFSAAFGDDLDG